MVHRWIGQRKEIDQVSPIYSGSQTNISANASIVNEFSDVMPYANYQPFNFFRIVNKTDKDLILYLNDNQIIVPVGTIQSIDGDSVPAFSRFRIKSIDDTLASGTVAWNFQKVSTVREEIAKKRFF